MRLDNAVWEAKRKRFLKAKKEQKARQRALARNKASPKYNYDKFKNTYLSLKRAAELAGISWPTALKYKSDKRVVKYERRFSRYTRPRYAWGVCTLFIRMKREAEKNRGPKRKRGRKVTEAGKWKRRKALKKAREFIKPPTITEKEVLEDYLTSKRKVHQLDRILEEMDHQGV